MCTRDEARAKAAIESINALPNPKGSKVGEVVFLQMDLENPRGVHNAALTILEKETRLDIVGMFNLFPPRVEFLTDALWQ